MGLRHNKNRLICSKDQWGYYEMGGYILGRRTKVWEGTEGRIQIRNSRKRKRRAESLASHVQRHRAELFKDNFKREVDGCLWAVGGAGQGEGKVTFEPCIEEGETLQP